MSKWDRMDKKSWEGSEVMNQFEKLIAKATVELKKKVEAQQQQEISRKLKEISTDTQTASKEMGNFMDMAKNLAIDEDGEPLPLSPEEQAEAEASLIQELNELAIQAADDGLGLRQVFPDCTMFSR